MLTQKVDLISSKIHTQKKPMLTERTEWPGLVALYDIRPGNEAQSAPAAAALHTQALTVLSNSHINWCKHTASDIRTDRTNAKL